MKKINYEMLRERRERVLKMRAETEEEQQIGLGYVFCQ